MTNPRQLIGLWIVLTTALAGGLVLASKVGSLSFNAAFSAADVTRLLTTFFVLALFVERTLEVFITAWAGEGYGSARD